MSHFLLTFVTVASSFLVQAFAICPGGWVQLEGQGCFLFSENASMTWDDAQAFCESQNGFLVRLITSLIIFQIAMFVLNNFLFLIYL